MSGAVFQPFQPFRMLEFMQSWGIVYANREFTTISGMAYADGRLIVADRFTAEVALMDPLRLTQVPDHHSLVAFNTSSGSDSYVATTTYTTTGDDLILMGSSLGYAGLPGSSTTDLIRVLPDGNLEKLCSIGSMQGLYADVEIIVGIKGEYEYDKHRIVVDWRTGEALFEDALPDWGRNATFRGRMMYRLSAASDSLLAVDFSDPTDPTISWAIANPFDGPMSFRAGSDILVLCHDIEYQIFELSVGAQPILISAGSLDHLAPGLKYVLYLESRRLIARSSSPVIDPGFVTELFYFDINPDGSLAFLGSRPRTTEESNGSRVVRQGVAYHATGNSANDILAFDVVDPLSPRQLGRLHAPASRLLATGDWIVSVVTDLYFHPGSSGYSRSDILTTWPPACLMDQPGDGDDPGLPPATARIEAVYPNPFNGAATLRFTLPRVQKIDLAVFDLRGRRVKTVLSGTQPEGTILAQWQGLDDTGRTSPSGVYFVRLKTDDFIDSRKISHIK